MKRVTKRSVQISVKMTNEDLALFKNAADHLWLKAPLSQSSIVLGLARIGAESVLPVAPSKPQPSRRGDKRS
jgi:hypothetical protein